MNIPPRTGTPLSYSATRVMLPGAGEPGKEVIVALRRPGEETSAIGRFETAPKRARDAAALIRPVVP